MSKMNQHHKIGDYVLHVFRNAGDWEVWLNTEVEDFDGICIGGGATRDEAVAAAVKVLEEVVAKLQEPPK